MGFLRIASKRERRARLFGALFAVATALVALGFFQGFEADTSNWFADGSAIVNRVSSPNQSLSFNLPNTTSVYGDSPIAASSSGGSFFGRVQSAVKDGTCVVDTTGAIGPSLLCFGPFTDFGLVPAFHVAQAFPSGGYSDQLDIYLDVPYATEHQDCSTAPCTPNTSTVNTQCVPSDLSTCTDLVPMDPSLLVCPSDTDLSCEGSRFTWTVGLNDPSGNFHRDYVFQVGTLAAGQVTGCPNGGYSINAQYNSFRSGGNPYQGFETKCLDTSGWYTFKEVFSNDSGNLHVDWSILNANDGTVAGCKDPTTGTVVGCTWGRTQTVDPITSIGCPRYGWLANEEINDLAIDNTEFAGDCPQGIQNQITPTDTTCQDFASGAATTLDQLLYTTKSGKINAVSPGVFFYYTKVTGATGNSVFISQSETETQPGNIPIQKLQAILYSSTCTKLGLLTVKSDGTASGTLPSTGDFIIGVKYTPSSLKGKNPPSPSPTDTYTFDTELNNILQHTATINLTPK